MSIQHKNFFVILAVVVVAFLALSTFVYAGCGGCGSGKSCSASKPARAEAPQAQINTPALAALIRAKVPVTILDARTSKWDDGRRIPGAKTLTSGESLQKIRTLAPQKGGLIVTYCGSTKCPLSHKLAHRLGELGYTNVVEYAEGIAGWTKAGLPVQTVSTSAPRKACCASCRKGCSSKSK